TTRLAPGDVHLRTARRIPRTAPIGAAVHPRFCEAQPRGSTLPLRAASGYRGSRRLPFEAVAGPLKARARGSPRFEVARRYLEGSASLTVSLCRSANARRGGGATTSEGENGGDRANGRASETGWVRNERRGSR